MPTEIDTPALQRLLDRGAQLVEVLPEEEYAEQHLPGALHIPLRQVTPDGVAGLDPGRPVVVYCFDYQ